MEPIKTITLKIEGMTCTSCARTVERALRKVEGVQSVSVHFATGEAILQTAKAVPLPSLAQEVEKAGYKLIPPDTEEPEEAFLRKERSRLLWAWIFTFPITVKMLLHMLAGVELIPHPYSFWIDVLFSGLVIFIVGYPVLRATFQAIKTFSFPMDSLIGLGTLAAFSTSLLQYAGLPVADFSVVGAMIMAIHFVGNYLKVLSTGRASLAIKQLSKLQPLIAHRLTLEGVEDVPLATLKVGDIVLVKPGEKIPSDGTIIEGNTSIDESLATGESIPVDRKPQDKVIGSTLNQTGVIKVRIERVGADTFLSRVIQLVEEAQRSKVPIQELADRITGIFVPLVLILSLLTFFLWLFFAGEGANLLNHLSKYIPWMPSQSTPLSFALSAAIATLVIACPCALGLATPTALMVGMGKAASHGILIRRGEAIQRMKDVNTLGFDKTGTLTKGKPTVTSYETQEPGLCFSLALAVESVSEHPLARSMVSFLTTYLSSHLTEIEYPLWKIIEFEAIPGKGLNARVVSEQQNLRLQVVVGSLKYLGELGLDTTPYTSKAEILYKEGHTVVGVGITEGDTPRVLGIFGIRDTLKEEAREAIQALHALGLKIFLLTGDNTRAAETIAKEAGIDLVFAELLPQDKIRIIRELQTQGKVVAMVGDGINDAPAIKQADVGIALGSGTDIAMEAADLTLVSGNLTSIRKAFGISRSTFRKIRQNLFWALFYNIIALPLAMLGLLHPVVAEIAMAFSSISVVTNSLRLRRWRG
ncbi:MAG: cation-translocating P-type ATPase [Spirochaetales bacterium]